MPEITCSSCFIVTPIAIDKNNLSAFTSEAFLMSPNATGTIEGFTETIIMSDFWTTGTFSKRDSAPKS